MRWPSLAILLLILAACAAPPSPISPVSTPALTSSPLPTPTATPLPTPLPTVDLDVFQVDPPPRPFDYVVVNAEPPRRVPNATRTFLISDGGSGERREVEARLRAQTEHVAMWVEEGVWHDVRQLEASAAFFENDIYATTCAVFGSEWIPGVDNDPHIHILHATGLGEGVLAYTSTADEFPRTIYPYSNQAEMITINVDAVEVGSPTYYALLIGQHQRLAQWVQDRNEERWVKEGLAELVVRSSGFNMGRPELTYLGQPDTSLVHWDEADTVAHSGAAYLFAAYFHQRFGDDGIRALVTQPLNGTTGFDATLAGLGEAVTFEDVFADWLVTNYLIGEPGYAYTALDLVRPTPTVYQAFPVTAEASVQQFGVDYVFLESESDLTVRFSATPQVSLLDVAPHSGDHVWWSNQADASLTTLKRAFDLSAVGQATLNYWVWYDVEAGYDYATVEISLDGGNTWLMLSTPSGTDADPHFNNPGWGYTGQSGEWVFEQVDLTPYVGNEVVVRFGYLTDETISRMGFLVDDIAIPEISYADDVESGTGGWAAAGFVRTTQFIPQRTLALLIGLGDPIIVERLPVGEDQSASWTLPFSERDWEGAVLIFSGLAPHTARPAQYRLTIE